MPPRKPGEVLPSAMLSRDPAVIKACENDPLVYREPIPTGFAMGGMIQFDLIIGGGIIGTGVALDAAL